MKFVHKLIFGLLYVCLSSTINSSHLKKYSPLNIVVDNTSNPSLHHAIRHDPTLTVIQTRSPIVQNQVDHSVMSFGNTSDNNGLSLPNHDYGKSPEIAGPAIYVHSKGDLSVLQEQPAHVGWRSEKNVITSLNKKTSIYILFNTN